MSLSGIIYWTGIVAIFVICGLAARFTAPIFGIDLQIVYAGYVVLAFLLVSIWLALIRRTFRKELEVWPEEDLQDLADSAPELYFDVLTERYPSERKLMRVGQIAICGPVMVLLFAPLFSWLYYHGEVNAREVVLEFVALVLLGLILAWIWWSVGVSKWRRWCREQGLDEDTVQWIGEHVQLLWPPGHFFEKTEYDNVIRWWRTRRR